MSKPNWVKANVVEREKGISKKAISHKRLKGQWTEKKHYRRGPDNVLYYDLNAINEWIEGA